MNALTQEQQNYMEIITAQMKSTVEKHNISPEYFQANFKEIFTAVHNSYQEFLKGLLTDEEYKNRIFEASWKELRGE